jgi:hypothetical protein
MFTFPPFAKSAKDGAPELLWPGNLGIFASVEMMVFGDGEEEDGLCSGTT